MIKAINNYCVLQLLEPSEELRSGVILLPQISSSTPRWANVLSVGEGVYDANGILQKPDVSPGETVYVMTHGQYSVHKNQAGEHDNVAAASVLDILVKLEDMKDLKIQPLGSYVEIEKIEIDQTTEFGIQLPESRKSPTNMGKVVSVGLGWIGPDGTNLPMQVKVGDTVVYNPLRTMVVDFQTLGQDNKKYIIQHGDIIGIIE